VSTGLDLSSFFFFLRVFSLFAYFSFFFRETDGGYGSMYADRERTRVVRRR
jgi:hypothetical protein